MTTWPALEQISKIAKGAAHRHPSAVLTYDDRVTAARDGIIDALLQNKEGDLRDHAAAGINQAVVTHCHHYGLARSGRHTGTRFAVYWQVTGDRGSFADDLTDQIAVTQVINAIHPAYQTTLRAYADTGCSIAGTASTLGISYKAATERVRNARNAARTLMFEPDQPPLWHRKFKLNQEGCEILQPAQLH